MAEPIPHQDQCRSWSGYDCTCSPERKGWRAAEAALSEALLERDEIRSKFFNSCFDDSKTIRLLREQVTQQAATIQTVTEFLEAIVIAFKEPDGGPCFKLRAFAEKQGIYADDLGRDRVMLRIAQAALDSIPKESQRCGSRI